ncbi:serine/threonine-protein kinase [Streptomyces sp. DSM 41634]|uniref:serine/threonine-protein kinase n=1 Tax=Streptomyces sp. DSM 41634 TaxID=3448656 RepID=UPI0028850EA9|nr:serine/threonine-protein kinase [Streptomyces sp. DSM 41633]
MAEYVEMSLGMGVLAVVGPALAVRLVSLPLLVRAQRGVRERVSATGGAAVARPEVSAAALGELALAFVGGIGLLLWMTSDVIPGFDLLLESIATGHALALAIEFGIPLATARLWFLGAAIPVLLVWLVLWVLTQRNLLAAGPSARVWASPAVRFRLAALFALRLVLGVFLPAGLVLAALLCEIVALVASGRGRPVGGGATAVPPPDAQPAPDARTAAAAQAVHARPGHLPPVPSAPPAQPAAYVPTQADRGVGAAGRVDAGAASQIAYQELHPNEPRAIGGYRLLGRIGAGGMGTVYLARREGAVTQVALKTIHPELLDHAELLQRFEREAEVLAMVSGAYTARVLDSGVDSGRPYLAMELLDGRPLDVHLREQGPIRSPEALKALALALAVALSGVHRLGLVHRDLKPANIMLTTAGPRLLDFGIAAIVDGTRLTRTGGGPGTLTYMAPEQFGDERVGTAADVWAWACCVVCAAHGTSPFSATSTGAVIRRIVDTGPEPAALAAVQALDPALAAAVTRALTADPAARPADGAALVELLTADRAPERPAPDAQAVREQITQGWRTLAL